MYIWNNIPLKMNTYLALIFSPVNTNNQVYITWLANEMILGYK